MTAVVHRLFVYQINWRRLAATTPLHHPTAGETMREMADRRSSAPSDASQSQLGVALLQHGESKLNVVNEDQGLAWIDERQLETLGTSASSKRIGGYILGDKLGGGAFGGEV